jgi:alpha-tubulin suppressor-like RCC1 family protein
VEKTMNRIKSVHWVGLLVSALLIHARMSGEEGTAKSPQPSQTLTAATVNAEEVVQWGMDVGAQLKGNPPGSPQYVVDDHSHPLTSVRAISARGSHGLALLEDGTVFGWGWNGDAQATGIGQPAIDSTNGRVVLTGRLLTNIIAVAAGRTHSLALRDNGTVIGWGRYSEHDRGGEMNLPPGLTNIVAIAAGWDFSLALAKSGRVVEWGESNIHPPADLTNIVAIAAGIGYGGATRLALDNRGFAHEWSRGVDFESSRVAASNVVAIVAGGGHCLALRADGTVYGWGANGSGQATGVPTHNSAVAYRSAGTVAVAGQPLTNVTRIAAGVNFSLALKQDGTVVSWVNNHWQNANVPTDLTGVVAIAAGENFSLAITTNVACGSAKMQR